MSVSMAESADNIINATLPRLHECVYNQRMLQQRLLQSTFWHALIPAVSLHRQLPLAAVSSATEQTIHCVLLQSTQSAATEHAERCYSMAVV